MGTPTPNTPATRPPSARQATPTRQIVPGSTASSAAATPASSAAVSVAKQAAGANTTTTTTTTSTNSNKKANNTPKVQASTAATSDPPATVVSEPTPKPKRNSSGSSPGTGGGPVNSGTSIASTAVTNDKVASVKRMSTRSAKASTPTADETRIQFFERKKIKFSVKSIIRYLFSKFYIP